MNAREPLSSSIKHDSLGGNNEEESVSLATVGDPVAGWARYPRDAVLYIYKLLCRMELGYYMESTDS